jgi:O-antigen/teichoic acid export membrane protein
MFVNVLRMNLLDRTTLKQRVLNAGLWSLAGFASNMVIRFGSNLLMTRLLMPESFGVMSIASTVVIGLTMFSDLGLRQFIVQSKRGNDPSYLNTAWAIQILRGVVLWFISITISLVIVALGRAGLISGDSVYASPILPPVIAVLCFSAVISGFASTRLLEASRDLSLGPLTRIEIVAQIIGLVCMFAWVWIDRSIWALVAGGISATFARALLSHFSLPGLRNRWQWDRSAALEILHFGKWIFLSSILGFLVNSGDQLLLGGLVNSTVLGLYVIASLYVSAVDGILSKLMGDVSLPAFSEVVRERPADLKQHYYRFHRIIAAIAYFFSGFLMAFGQSLIGLLYDNRYESSGHILEIIAAILLTIPFRLVTQSFLALGMPKLQSHVILIRLISLMIFTPVGFYLAGLVGALSGIVFSHFSYIPIIISYNLKHKLFDLKKELYVLVLAPAGFSVGTLLSTAAGHLK